MRGGRGPRPNYALVLRQLRACSALYVVALPWLGFRVATFLYVAAADALLARPRDAKSWVRSLVLALLTAAITYSCSSTTCSVLLPRGRWTGF